MTLGLAVAVAVQVVGVLLIFALLVIPAAIAERLTRRPAATMAVSIAAAVAATMVGLVLGYYYSPPVSFFITTVAFVGYVAARLAGRAIDRRAGAQGAARPASDPAPG